MATEELETRKSEMLEHEDFRALSIGGEVSEPSDSTDRKKVNFHQIRRELDRELSYEIARSILSLQKRKLQRLHRVENYDYI